YMALAVALVMPRGRRARRVASPAVVVRAAAARPGRAMPGASMPAAPRAAPARVAARPVTSWMREMRRRALVEAGQVRTSRGCRGARAVVTYRVAEKAGPARWAGGV